MQFDVQLKHNLNSKLGFPSTLGRNVECISAAINSEHNLNSTYFPQSENTV